MQRLNIGLFVKDHVATVTFNRPERKNAWNTDMEHEFRQVMQEASDDPEIRVVIITGAGSAFCVGADMERLGQTASKPDANTPAATMAVSEDDYAQRYSWLLAIDKPVIAAINGAVAGVGLCLTLYCDFRYMAEGARMSTAFARRGLIAEHGSAWLLPRIIGPMNAADLLLSGRTLTAHEAQEMGLVRVLPANDFAAQVQQKAAELALLSSPRSVRIIKRQLRDAANQSLASAIQFADAQTVLCRNSEDFKEGVASFRQKRTPNFTGH